MLRGSIAERGLYALVDEVVTGLRGVDAVGADERRENTAFQKFRPQVDEPAAERAAELRDHVVVVFLPAVQMVGVAQPAEDVLGAEPLGDEGKIPALLQRGQGGHGHARASLPGLADGGAVAVDEALRRGVRQMLAVRIGGDGLPVIVAVVAAEAEQHRRILRARGEPPVDLLEPRVDGRAHPGVVFHCDALRGDGVKIMVLAQMVALAVIGDSHDDGVAEDHQFFHGKPSCAAVNFMYPV